jgi:hypothetical protein
MDEGSVLPTSLEPSPTSVNPEKKPKNKTLKKKVISKESVILVELEEDLLKTFVEKGISSLETLGLNDLTNMLQYASKQYYNHSPVISDNQFDIIKNYIDTKYPMNKATKEIGAEVERNKVVLPFEMASMDKIKPDTGALANWCQKFRGPYVLSCKLDGVSGLYCFDQSINGSNEKYKSCRKQKINGILYKIN